MRTKSDSTLKYVLLELHERAGSEDVARVIMDVLEHVGQSSPYRGGKPLLELLEFARSEADRTGDEETESGLSDALAYATGRLLDEDLSEKYDLYSGSGQDPEGMLTRVTSGMYGLAAAELDDFLRGNPQASVADVQAHFSGLRRRALRFVKARRAGYYEAFRIRTEGMAWVTDVLADRTKLQTENDDRIEALLADGESRLLLAAAQLRLRERELDAFRGLVENRYSKEVSLQRFIKKNPWIFGGRYAGVSGRRRLAAGTELDIPLLRPDGVLQVVELKRASVKVVKEHRSGSAPTADVHDAIVQVENYLRTLDERRDELLEEQGIDTRRASGIVVIGHPRFQPGYGEAEINETLRSHASHLARVDVMTYKELIDSAERSLVMGDDHTFLGP